MKQWWLSRASLAGAFIFLVTGCGKSPHAEPSYYFWRSTFNLTEKESSKLQTPGLRYLYVRMADLAWDRSSQSIIWRAPLRGLKPSGVEVIPVFFLSQRLFLDGEASQLKRLPRALVQAARIQLAQAGLPPFRELQVDHDWMPQDREAYFEFLRTMSLELKGLTLSATVRLHQLKAGPAIGVPPVTRGLLMAYHTGDTERDSAENCLLDRSAARTYLKPLERYPLPLDLGLPIFHWTRRFSEDGRLKGTLALGASGLFVSPDLERTGQGWRVRRSTFFAGQRVQAGERLRLDQPRLQDLRWVARRFGREASSPYRIVFYHLDQDGALDALEQDPWEAVR